MIIDKVLEGTSPFECFWYPRVTEQFIEFFWYCLHSFSHPNCPLSCLHFSCGFQSIQLWFPQKHHQLFAFSSSDSHNYWGLACKWIPNFQPLVDVRLSTCHHKQILQPAPVEWNDITFNPSTYPMLFCYIFHCCSHVWDTNLLYWKKLNYKLIIMNKWKQSAKNWLHPTFTNAMIIHQIIPTFKTIIPPKKKTTSLSLILHFP